MLGFFKASTRCRCVTSKEVSAPAGFLSFPRSPTMLWLVVAVLYRRARFGPLLFAMLLGIMIPLFLFGKRTLEVYFMILLN